MSWLMPHTVGSNPGGSAARRTATNFVLSGTRISVPALRETCQSLETGDGTDHRVHTDRNGTNRGRAASEEEETERT